MGALNNKGGQGQRNREQIGAGTTFFIFLAASPLSRDPDKTAMLRRLRKRVMHGGLDLLDHSFLIYIKGNTIKIPLPPFIIDVPSGSISMITLDVLSSCRINCLLSRVFFWQLGTRFSARCYCREVAVEQRFK